MKRLYKSTTDKKLEGVCAGIADYYDIDPTLVRAIFLIGTVLTGVLPGAVIYVALAVIMPQKPGKA